MLIQDTITRNYWPAKPTSHSDSRGGHYESPIYCLRALQRGNSRTNQWLFDFDGEGNSHPLFLDKLQDRGKFFIHPGEEIYTGQVIGENSRADDLVVNVTKTKKLSNVRAAGSDDKVKLAPPIQFSLEEALEYIQKDEYVEVTPNSQRLRKIYLDENERKRQEKQIG